MRGALRLGAVACCAALCGCSYSVASGPGGTTVTRSSPLLFLDGAVPRPAPAMKADREVSEQDCTRPIVNPGANLRCAPPGAAGKK